LIMLTVMGLMAGLGVAEAHTCPNMVPLEDRKKKIERLAERLPEDVWWQVHPAGDIPARGVPGRAWSLLQSLRKERAGGFWPAVTSMTLTISPIARPTALRRKPKHSEATEGRR
jgi:hypothetical protein